MLYLSIPEIITNIELPYCGAVIHRKVVRSIGKYMSLGAAFITIHQNNDTSFGLSAGICTTSLKYASHFKRHVEAGMVMVNLPTAGVDYHVPFGGRKASSCGPREQGQHAVEFYTTVKTSYTLPL